MVLEIQLLGPLAECWPHIAAFGKVSSAVVGVLMMKHGKWLGLVFSALLISAFIWGIKGASVNEGSDDPAAKIQPDSPNPAVSDQAEYSAESDFDPKPARAVSRERSKIQRDPAAVEPNSELDIMRNVAGAPSAVERANALERLAETDPVLAARKLLELAAFCSPKHLRAQESLDASRELLEQRRNWCSGLSLSMEAMKARVQNLMQIDEELQGEAARVERLARDPYIGRRYEMEEELANAGDDNRSDRFTQLVRQARDFSDINSLATLNKMYAQDNGGRPLWRLGAEVQRGLYPQAQLLEAQTVAIFLFGCQRFGGCGAGEYMTMVSCTIGVFGQCGPGSSLQQHLYLTTAPVTFSLSQNILARI